MPETARDIHDRQSSMATPAAQVWADQVNNIFLMDGSLGPEDRLTFSWAYVLNTDQKFAQKVVDRISARTGLPSPQSSLRRSIIRRALSGWLAAETSRWSMVLEHKLQAGLGVKQLRAVS